MSDNILPRRKALMLATVGASAVVGMGMGGLAGCNTTDVTSAIKTVADFIQKVQQTVSDAMKKACNSINAIVPTVDTVLAVVEGFLGAVPNGQNIAQLVAFFQQTVDTIVAGGCPPAPSPALRVTPLKATVNGKEIPIVFY